MLSNFMVLFPTMTEKIVFLIFIILLIGSLYFFLFLLLKLVKIKIGSFELTPNNSNPRNHLSTFDMYLLLEIQAKYLKQIFTTTDEHRTMREQMNYAEMIIENLIHDSESCKDLEFLKMKILNKLRFVFRENHLAEIIENELFQRVSERIENIIDMISKYNAELSCSDIEKIQKALIGILTKARQIAISKRCEAEEIEREYKNKISKILRGENNERSFTVF